MILLSNFQKTLPQKLRMMNTKNLFWKTCFLEVSFKAHRMSFFTILPTIILHKCEKYSETISVSQKNSPPQNFFLPDFR